MIKLKWIVPEYEETIFEQIWISNEIFRVDQKSDDFVFKIPDASREINTCRSFIRLVMNPFATTMITSVASPTKEEAPRYFHSKMTATENVSQKLIIMPYFYVLKYLATSVAPVVAIPGPFMIMTFQDEDSLEWWKDPTKHAQGS